MALDKKGGFGLDLESQFKNAPRVTDVEPVDAHTHTHTDTDTYADIEQMNKTKRTYGLVQQTIFDKVPAGHRQWLRHGKRRRPHRFFAPCYIQTSHC